LRRSHGSPRPESASAARLLLVLALFATWGCEPSEDTARQPDVVLVLLDTLRPDHLELLGYEHETAPFLTELGTSGAVFERAFSTSAWTPPATASLVTGLYPERHGVVHGFEIDADVMEQIEQGLVASVPVVPLPSQHPTLAERFREAGYATFGVATNVHVNEYVGYGRGFDRFELQRDADAGQAAELLAGFLAEAADDRPRFVSLHLNDVHRPYHKRAPWYAPRSGRLGNLVAAYDSEISFVDSQLRAMHDRFGWAENTLLCVVSDHGEGFGESGLVGHGPSLSWVVNRCLMIFSGQGVPPGRIEANVSLVDVTPTLLELAGLSPATGLDGISLVPLLDSQRRAAAEATSATRPLFAQRRHRRKTRDRFLWSVVQGRWKLVHDELGNTTTLYDMAADAAEQHDLFDSEPAKVSDLRALHQAHASGTVAPSDGPTDVELDAELLSHLQALGYAGNDDEH